MKPIAPCRDCTDRHATCHSDCERYKEWQKVNDEYNERKRAHDEKTSWRFFKEKTKLWNQS